MSMKVDYSGWMNTWEKEYTLTRQFHRNVLRWGEKTVLVDPYHGRTFTFKELDEESNRFAHALLDFGVEPFEVVMGNVMNTFHWFTIFLGAMKARIIFSTVNFRLPEGQIARLMADSAPAVFLYDPEVEESSLKALDRIGKTPKACIRLGDGGVVAQGTCFL